MNAVFLISGLRRFLNKKKEQFYRHALVFVANRYYLV